MSGGASGVGFDGSGLDGGSLHELRKSAGFELDGHVTMVDLRSDWVGNRFALLSHLDRALHEPRLSSEKICILVADALLGLSVGFSWH